MLGRAMRPARDARARRGDLDRLARAGGEDDVMTPAERLRERLARFLEQGAGGAAFAVRRAGVGPGVEARAPSPSRASGSTGVVAAWSR